MAESGNSFVKKLSFSSSNLAADWKQFKAQLDIYKIAKKFGDMGEEEKIANALLLMGSESVPIYQQFTFDEEVPTKEKTLDNVLTMFANHCEPVKNTIYERVKFNSMRQGELSIHQFITNLLSQADLCDYGVMRDELVRDRIVVGVNDPKLREYLIDVDGLDLASCVQKSKQYISHHDHIRRMEVPTVDENVDSVGQGKARNYKSGSYKGQGAQSSGSAKTCYFCSKEPHKREKCPAKLSTCHACKLKGHWAKSKACKGKQKRSNQNDEVLENEEGTVEDSVEGLYLGDS